ncbi:unnamed protein product [Plutella xylostella]|uniref:(diamondback moth) hypothetical protein n=1 Tax=Plutella xylostella TaxID=51655 RepID=A0A8S4GD96_PLUXY|nr:unnamed protein product [Plutella xylostella]
MSKQIRKLKEQKILVRAPPSPSFVSPIFLVAKSDCCKRPIFNLRNLNRYLHQFKFRLINMYRVPDFLQQGDWAIKIDLKQAYFHIPVARSHQPFLRVLYKTDTTVASAPTTVASAPATVELLQVTSLPFGLSSAPKAFATVSNWVAQLMRNQGLRVVVYLDDYLIVHQERQTLIEHVAEAVRILKILGFTINFEKSALIPSRIVEYLGITWNLATNSKYLPRDKRRRIVTKIQSIVASYSWSLRDASVRSRHVEFCIVCRPSRAASLPPLANGLRSPSQEQTIYKTLFRSNSFGGAGMVDTSTLCQQKYTDTPITMYALPDDRRICHRADNKSVVSYIRNQGGLRSRALFQITNMLFHVMDEHNIEMITQYIPGQLNTEADLLSRQKTQTEWYLTEEACREIFDRFGTPVIDLFASRTAHILTSFTKCRPIEIINGHFDPRDPLSIDLSELLLQQYTQEHRDKMIKVYELIHDSCTERRENIMENINKNREPEPTYNPDQPVFVKNPLAARQKLAPRFTKDTVLADLPIHMYTKKERGPVAKSRLKRVPKNPKLLQDPTDPSPAPDPRARDNT